MIRFPTDLHGYSLQWSPFVEGRLAVAASQHYGIVGNGRLIIVQVVAGRVEEQAAFDTSDGLYDVAWSEQNEHHLVCCSGDGSIKFYDLAAGAQGNPVMAWHEHKHEVYSINWNLVTKDRFVTSTLDAQVSVWDPSAPRSLISYAGEHTYCVYNAIWSPHRADVFATASGDCTMKLFDTNAPRAVQSIAAHDFEVLTCDWNKYNEHEIATGSVDKTIRLWDLRHARRPVNVLEGHTFPPRKVQYSPHAGNVLASCGYDMTVMLWDTVAPVPIVNTMAHHAEFVVGLDFCLFNDLIACSSWDGTVSIWPTSLAT